MVNKLQDCWVNKGMKPVCTDCGSDNLQTCRRIAPR